MASTKAVTVLHNDESVAAGGADETSSAWTLDDGYGGAVMCEITNGATGPTVAGQIQLRASPDNTTYYDYGGPMVGGTTNSGVYTWTVPIPIGIEYIKAVIGSNTGQAVTFRVEGSEVTAI